jgi:hypothetical protein
MKKVASVFSSHAEADKADREYYLSLTPEQRMDILLELVQRAQDEAGSEFKRVYRVTQFE